MAASNMLRAGNFSLVGNFQHRSGSVNYIKIRSGSRIRTPGPYKFNGNPWWKIQSQESTRFHAPFMQFSTKATNNEETTKGRQLVEIFSAQILGIDPTKSADLFGEIRAEDGLGDPQYILRRRISVSPKELIPLEGPKRAISARKSFSIDVTFKSPDYEVIRGQIEWNNLADNIYDQPITTEIKGKYGSIAICYAVYSNAVLANVQLQYSGNNEEVYGTIDASNTLSNQPIALFNKKREDVNPYVYAKPRRQPVPLQRSMVVVPLGSSVKVDADLRDQDLDPGDIIKGSVKFPAASSGRNSDIIKVETLGWFDVTVTWSQ